MAGSLGRQFVEAVVARDLDSLARLVAEDVDFRGVTPGRFWEASTPADVVDVVLGNWFGETDHIDSLAHLEEGDPVADTQRIGYRFQITNPDGPHVVEQQAYYREQDGRLTYMRVVCSGYRRAPE